MTGDLNFCGHPGAYGRDSGGRRWCYACCGLRDVRRMTRTGRAVLYLTKQNGAHVVTNWPGSLKFPASYCKAGRHNMARTRTDAWFTGPNGTRWHGVNIGDNEILHCKRIK
jgi:hypothetical protein